jgi:ubiquinol-cytochrome c reductase cytochrome c subunit
MSTERAEARVVSRVLRVGLLAAVACQIGWSLRPSSTPAVTTEPTRGQVLYATNCSSCHGLQAEGTVNGPGLQGVGAAAVDFMLSSGRMPLANPADQPQRGEPKFSPAQIAAIVDYVESIAPGGPPIPSVNPAAGSLPDGLEVYLNTCSACHGAGATGDSIGGGQIAPSLSAPSPLQIAEAIRIGPGAMPRFNERNITQHDVDSVARYLVYLRGDNAADRGGLQLGRVGAVAEGLIAGVVGLGILVLVIRLTGSRS